MHLRNHGGLLIVDSCAALRMLMKIGPPRGGEAKKRIAIVAHYVCAQKLQNLVMVKSASPANAEGW
jgi:hypothetical protein